MSRLRSLIFSLFIAIPVPVNSIAYRVKFEPTKICSPCKESRYQTIQKIFDFSKLDINVATDNTLFIKGSLALTEDLDTDAPISILTTAKQKIRGRWIDSAYKDFIKDFCSVYYQEGKFWYEKVTKYFVGDQRACPPKKFEPLPINITLSLDMDVPTLVPNGEYMSHSVIKQGNVEACLEMFIELTQL